MSHYFQHVRGLMGAEKGNYTVSDLCMTVGFGLGLRVRSRMTETIHREVALVHGHIGNRPPNWDAAVSQVQIRANINILHLPWWWTPRCQWVRQYRITDNYRVRVAVHFCKVKIPQTSLAGGVKRRGNFPLSARICSVTVRWKGDYIITIVASELSAFPLFVAIQWTVRPRQRRRIPTV